jgi:chemotaxis protein CheD
VKTSAELPWQDLDQTPGQTGLAVDAPTLPTVYLHPGQLFVAAGPAAVTTILGSCVAVCVWDVTLGIGGINHYLLPTGLRTASTGPRYGNVAIEQLLEKLERAGTRVPNLRAKIFGGACVLDAMRGKENHLGGKNVEIARNALAEAGIPVVASDVGGGRGRKLIFYPHDGSALVKLL